MLSILSRLFPPRMGSLNLNDWQPTRHLVIQQTPYDCAGAVKFWNGRRWQNIPKEIQSSRKVPGNSTAPRNWKILTGPPAHMIPLKPSM